MYINKLFLLDFIKDQMDLHEREINNSNIPYTIERNSGAFDALLTLKNFIDKDIFSLNDYEEFLLKRGYDPSYSLDGQKPSILRMIYYKIYFYLIR